MGTNSATYPPRTKDKDRPKCVLGEDGGTSAATEASASAAAYPHHCCPYHYCSQQHYSHWCSLHHRCSSVTTKTAIPSKLPVHHQRLLCAHIFWNGNLNIPFCRSVALKQSNSAVCDQGCQCDFNVPAEAIEGNESPTVLL